MNTLFLTVSINAVETFTLPANIVSVEQTVVLVQALIQNRPKTIFIEIKHSQLNTLLELTDIAPYELWYFNEKKEFTGKSFSLQNGNASFQIQTQARFIALVPYGINYSVVSTSDTIHDSKKCSLSATYLEESAPFSIERAEWTLSLFNLTDEELIETLNKEIQKKGWVQARAYYHACLSNEIRNRSFNSDILFDFDANGTVIAFKLESKVQLINNTVAIII